MRLENRRVACDSLLTYLDHDKPQIRARTVNALGKLQDAACVASVSLMLDDPHPDVQIEAAFALGQIGDPSTEKLLTDKLYETQSTELQAYIIEALGKVGTASAFLALIKFFNSAEVHLRQRTALAAARLASRGISNKTMTKALTLLLNDSNKEVRWRASYALMRIGTNLDVNAIRSATMDDDPRVRMHAVTTLGNLKDVTILERFGTLLRKDQSWRVRTKVAQALGNYPLSKAANYLTLLNQTNPHVKVAIIQAIGRSAQNLERFRQNSREHNLAKYELEQLLVQREFEMEESENDIEGEDESERQEWSDAELGFALISYSQLLGPKAIEVIEQYLDHPSERVRARAMQALGETGSAEVLPTLQQKYERAPLIVKTAILNAFAQIGHFRNPKLLIDALAEEDQVLVALAARGLAQDTVNSQKYTPKIVAAFEDLKKPLDPQVVQIILQALDRIGDEQTIPVLRQAITLPDKSLSRIALESLKQVGYDGDLSQASTATVPAVDFDFEEVSGLSGAQAFIKTNRGNIEFDLFPDEAPLTVWNFITLAEKGFYDRLTFHRVVPNFVIQSGDPRGDSWGSPGYWIRSEYNKHRYLRGTVGMASTGKDTEGSQFFITHSAQPHLNGRYTVFGQVTSGMDIVDAIQEGDLIELVSIRR